MIQFEEKYLWIAPLNAYYHLGVDGLSMPLLLLTTFLGFLAVLISWKVHERPREFFAWLLLLETSIIGVFVSLDLLLFFIMWEIEVIPMYFLISIWGSGRTGLFRYQVRYIYLVRQRFMLAGILSLLFHHPQPEHAGYLLTTFLGLLAVLISWKVHERPREFFAWLLLLETSIIGVFASLDLLLFFIMWEIEVIPMYFLITIWGSGRREYSAIKYVIYTLFGSAFMLAGILSLYFTTHSLSMVDIANQGLGMVQSAMPAAAIFWLLFIGFAVKLPMFPFHTWLPDAHTDAPTAVSVMLAGVLIKMGGYGMIRLCVSMFPAQPSSTPSR